MDVFLNDFRASKISSSPAFSFAFLRRHNCLSLCCSFLWFSVFCNTHSSRTLSIRSRMHARTHALMPIYLWHHFLFPGERWKEPADHGAAGWGSARAPTLLHFDHGRGQYSRLTNQFLWPKTSCMKICWAKLSLMCLPWIYCHWAELFIYKRMHFIHLTKRTPLSWKPTTSLEEQKYPP